MEPSAGLLTPDTGGTSTLGTEASTVGTNNCDDKKLEEDEDKKSLEEPDWLTSPHVTSQLEEIDDGGDTEYDDDVTEEETEMSRDEKREMYQAVSCGDIELLEYCLDRPNSDLNMTWFQENLLMAAIRHHQSEMAEFLLDNGINHHYTTTIVNLRETSAGKVLDRYELTSRQMAYDRGMAEVVELIDRLQGHVFPFIRPSPRTPRYRRPRCPTPSLSETSSQGADVSSSGSDDSLAGGRKKFRRKKKQSLDMAKTFDTQRLDMAKTFDTQRLDMAKTFDTQRLDMTKTFDTQRLDMAKTFDTQRLGMAKTFDTQRLDMAKTFDTQRLDMARQIKNNNSSTQQTSDVKTMEGTTTPTGQAKPPQGRSFSFPAPRNKLLARKKCTSALQPRPQTAHTSAVQPRPQTAHTFAVQPRPQTAHTSAVQPRPQTAHTFAVQPRPQTAHTSAVQPQPQTAKLRTESCKVKQQPAGCRKVTAPGSYTRELTFWQARRSPAHPTYDIRRVRSPGDVDDQLARPSSDVTDQPARPTSDVTSQAAPLPIRGILKSPTQYRLAADVPARSNKKSTLYNDYVTTTKRKLDPTFSSFYRALDFHGNKAIKHVTMSHSSFYGP